MHERFSVNKYGWHRWVFDHFNLPENSLILELGCGSGKLWAQNIDRIPPAWNIILSDFSAGMLHDAGKNLCNSQNNFKYMVLDAQYLPFNNKTFHCVIANHMLYHVPDTNRVFSEISRILMPGGRFYASTVGLTHMQEIDRIVRKVEPGFSHITGYGPDAFVLERGSHMLSKYFSEIKLHMYDDCLVVTEALPLVDYILSATTMSSIAGRRNELLDLIEEEIIGSIRITKSSGIFETVCY